MSTEMEKYPKKNSSSLSIEKTLTNQNGIPFDRALAAQIYAQIDKGPDGQISENEFIRIWINSENQFIDQINRNNAEIAKAQEQKKQIESKIREMMAIEKRGGGFRDSTLTINVIDGQNIEYERTVVTVDFKDQQFASNEGETRFPMYNSVFRFQGVDIKDVIRILVNPVQPGSEEDQPYSGDIRAEDLTDQKIHEVWLPLALQGKKTEAKLHISTHYVYSQVQIAQEAIRDWDRLIADYEAKNIRLRNDLNEIYRPLDFVSTINASANTLKLRANDTGQVEDVLEPKFQSVPERPIHPFYTVSFYLSLAILAVCFLSMDYKNHVLIDMCVCFSLISMYLFEEIGFSALSLVVTFVLALISYIIEIKWYKTYTANWWSSVYIDDGSLVGFRQYQKYVSWLSILFKTLLLVSLGASCVVALQKRSK